MNASLIGFSVLLIVGGVVVGINILIVLGIFLLIPGLLTTPKKQSRIPVSKGQQPRRSYPASTAPATRADFPSTVAVQAQAPVSPAVPTYVPPPTSMSTGPTFSPPLFPHAIFPTLSLPSSYTQQSPGPKAQPAQDDELLELGALVAVLRLAFG